MQRKLTTILAADVVGYSRLAAADEEGTVSRLRALRHELIDPVIAAHNGRTFKTTGDGRITEFASVVDAVRAALEVQRGMAQRNANMAPEKRIDFRVGIHLGDVIVEGDGDLMGDGVNIAARLEGIAEPGGICLSDDAYRQVRDKVAADFADLGDKELKNIARPVRVYAIQNSAPSRRRPGPTGIEDSPSRSVDPDFRRGGEKEGGAEQKKEGPPRLSIVVLPFANIGGDPEQDYFVDGVTESLTTDLSRIAGSFVIARNTAFTFKGKPIDVKQIGRELNVRYVLEGSVQRGGNRMRVNVQLIEAETGAHLWAERFDKPVADLFDMQDEIVARLANQLDTELLFAEARRVKASPNPDSMDLYFQGMVRVYGALDAENLTAARDLFDRALVLDSQNVEALCGLATAEFASGAVLMDHRAGHLGAAEAAALKALALAPNHILSHHILANTYLLTGRVAQAIATAEWTLALDRNMATAHAVIGHAKLFDGRAEDTEAHILEALRLSPKDALAWHWLFVAGMAKAALAQDEEAVAWLRRSVETFRYFPDAHFRLAGALALLGRVDEDKAAARAGLALDPGYTVSRIPFSDNPTFLAQYERALDGMRKAGVPEG